MFNKVVLEKKKIYRYISSPGISVSPENCSTTDPAMDSVHELPAKLVKEILTGELMELSKLLPKNFNVLRRTLVFSSQDPHHQVPLGGPKTVLVTTSTGGFPAPEPLASTPTNVTGLGAERIIPGSSAPISIEQIRNPPQGWEGQPPSTRAPATKKSSFGGVVTPVSVVNLYQALSNHPEREFVKKLCSELREEARIRYSCPRCPRCSHNLPIAVIKVEVVIKSHPSFVLSSCFL